jgi:hypothetical protein
MTDIEAKALALVREVLAERNLSDKRAVRREVSPYTEALCRALEQHEAFKQEVSDAVLSAMKVLLEMAEHDCEVRIRPILERFIIPKPKPKPDPLVEVMEKLGWYAETSANQLRAALEACGLKIVENKQQPKEK